MKELIKMQANPSVLYAVNYEVHEVMTVSNYQNANDILHLGYVSKKRILEIDDVDVGVWQPKGTKSKQINKQYEKTNY